MGKDEDVKVTLRQLRYFRALVEHGSFSRAAENVFVSQPALSLQIQELEGILGGPLVERDRRGIILTQLGRDVHQQALRVLDETLLLETLGKRFAETSLRVAVGMVSTLAPYLLPGVLERLQSASPRIELDLREASGQSLVSDLLAGRLDAAVVSLPLGVLELPERELFEDRFLLAGRPERLAAVTHAFEGEPRPPDLSRADLGPLLTLDEGHCLGEQIRGVCATWRLQEVRRGAGSLATLSRLVASGAGLTLLPETAILTERKNSPELGLFRFAAPEPSLRIGLVHRVASHGQHWIDVLGDAVADAGQALVKDTRAMIQAGTAAKAA
jgi:LysR family hydrogen peroxide-inducible transcriptional activator